ncbi:hypothetical protein T484DRAFT_3632864, partial [Baffinella frigidus]
FQVSGQETPHRIPPRPRRPVAPAHSPPASPPPLLRSADRACILARLRVPHKRLASKLKQPSLILQATFMTLLSCFCNKTSGVLSRIISSVSRSSVRKGSSPSSAQRCPSNDADLSYANTMVSCSSSVSNSNNSNPRLLGATSPDPADSVQELAASSSPPVFLSSSSRDASQGSCLFGNSNPSSRSSRYAALETALALDLFNSPPSQRYSAVEGMLLFLDAQAEHRASSGERSRHFEGKIREVRCA